MVGVVLGRTRWGPFLCSPVATGPSTRCPPKSAALRQQQLELAKELNHVLAEADHKNIAFRAAEVHEIVTRGVSIIRGSPDWQLLATAFHHCAEQYNQASGPSTGPVTGQRTDCGTSGSSSGGTRAMHLRQPGKQSQQTQPAASMNASSVTSVEAKGTSSMRPSRSSSSSSPWGFAMRQPQAAPRPARPAASISQMHSVSDAQQQRQQTDAEQWDWSSVESFIVLGLGSIGQYVGTKTPLTLSSSRLSFRLFQLVLAVALWRHMLPGLAHKPTAYDPEFDDFDRQLLTSLGFQVLDQEPPHIVTARTLMYMPCCPRQLYSQVLEANWSQESLHQLAIFGTSMQSFADTQTLFDSLTAEGPTGPETAAACQESSPSEVLLNAAGQTAAAKSTQAATAGSRQQQGTDFVHLAYKQGIVIEAITPDCAAHGVAVAVHLLRRSSLTVDAATA